MADADLDRAVDLVVKGGFSLSGQACTGTSRVLVDAPVKAAFTEKLLAKVKALKVGNSLEGSFDLGPLATARQLESVMRYIEVGKQEARLLYGGERLDGPGYERGYYLTPAVFADVTQQMRIAREEIFGPVIALIEVNGYEDAIAKANDTEYGLAAAIRHHQCAVRAPFRARYPGRHGEDQPHHHGQPDQCAVRRPEALQHLDVPRVGPHRAGVLYPDQDGLPRRLNPTRLKDDMKQIYRLELEEARVMIQAAIAKSEEIGVLESICIVDDGGYPIALERMNGARITGPQIAWNKAFTAAGQSARRTFQHAAQRPGLAGQTKPSASSGSFEGKFAVFVGGFPSWSMTRSSAASALSGGNGEQDTKAGVAALQALADMLAERGMKVMVAADIKK